MTKFQLLCLLRKFYFSYLDLCSTGCGETEEAILEEVKIVLIKAGLL